MAQGSALTEVEKESMAAMLATGKRPGDVAAAVGIGLTSVYRYRDKPTVKARIDELTQQYLDKAIPAIVETDLAVVKRTQPILSNGDAKQIGAYKTLINHYDGIRKQIMQIVGIAPSPTPSLFVQNNLIDQRTQVLSPVILGMLGQAQQDSIDCLDVEFNALKPQDTGGDGL